MKFSIYQNSLQGARKYNEDRVAYAYSRDALLTVLADGMGGHEHGDIAAEIAIRVLTESFQRLALSTLSNPFRFLSQHIQQAHDTIVQHAMSNDFPEAPCTTIVASIVQNNTLYCAHAGDSRLYHFRDGQLLFCTEDHSKVHMLYRRGVITREQMKTHRERNMIYNCIGGRGQPDIELARKRPMHDGDTVLLCSDGFWSLLDDAEIAEFFQHGLVMDTMPALFGLAESRVGNTGDNLSAIAFNWNIQNYDRFAISTETMPLSRNTIVDSMNDRRLPNGTLPAGQDASDSDIEYAIAEIETALKKNSR